VLSEYNERSVVLINWLGAAEIDSAAAADTKSARCSAESFSPPAFTSSNRGLFFCSLLLISRAETRRNSVRIGGRERNEHAVGRGLHNATDIEASMQEKLIYNNTLACSCKRRWQKGHIHTTVVHACRWHCHRGRNTTQGWFCRKGKF
jgi:hypothetical protein